MQQVYRKADFAQPEQAGPREQGAEVRGDDDGEHEEQAAEGAEEAAEVDLRWRQALAEGDERRAPGDVARVVGGDGHEDQGEEGERGGEEWGPAR